MWLFPDAVPEKRRVEWSPPAKSVRRCHSALWIFTLVFNASYLTQGLRQKF
jgi:hypothetical protein